eukprot:gene2066-1938_t
MGKKKAPQQSNQEEGWTTVEKKSTYVKKEVDPSMKQTYNQPKPLFSDNKNKIGKIGGSGGSGGYQGEKKYNSGHNKQRKQPSGNQVQDWDDDESSHDDGNSAKEIGIRIAQVRTSKGLTQIELAGLINEKVTVVSQYESGKVVVNHLILKKFEAALGKKLRNKK